MDEIPSPISFLFMEASDVGVDGGEGSEMKIDMKVEGKAEEKVKTEGVMANDVPPKGEPQEDRTEGPPGGAPGPPASPPPAYEDQEAAVDEAARLLVRDAPERVREAEERIKRDRYDTEAWTLLAAHALRSPIEEARDVYEAFLDVFPMAGRYWKHYVEQEITAKNYENAESIFQRCLPTCPHVDLFRTYLQYIRTIKEGKPDFKDSVIKAFEFALECVGHDIGSTSIWTDFISFLKAQATTSNFEDGQKMTSIRRIYQRAITNPMHNVDALWREYEAYEKGLNETLAAGLLKEHHSRYLSTRTTYRERKVNYQGIMLSALPVPLKGTEDERRQINLWKSVIQFEMGNPQKLDEKQLASRITYSYKEAVTNLYHCSEMWYMAAKYQIDQNNTEGTQMLFEQAIHAMPRCMLLHFAYAEFHEARKNVKAARQIYEKLVECNPDPLVFIQFMRFSRRTEGMDMARKIFVQAHKSGKLGFQAYVASALLEYRVNKDPAVGHKIFELGMKKFASEPSYVLQYIAFLTATGDEKNLLPLFERGLTTVSKEKAMEIWNRFLAFECECGDLQTMQRVDRRKVEAYDGEAFDSLSSLLHRYRYLDLWPCDPAEITLISSSRRSEEDTMDSRESIAARLREAAKLPEMSDPPPFKYPRPDLASMVPFRASGSVKGYVPYIAGTAGIYIPEALYNFLASLGPPHLHVGQVPDVDMVMASLQQVVVPHGFPPLVPPAPIPDTEASHVPPPQTADTPSLGRGDRKRKERNEENSDDEAKATPLPVNRPPINDPFRQRHMQRSTRGR